MMHTNENLLSSSNDKGEGWSEAFILRSQYELMEKRSHEIFRKTKEEKKIGEKTKKNSKNIIVGVWLKVCPKKAHLFN